MDDFYEQYNSMEDEPTVPSPYDPLPILEDVEPVEEKLYTVTFADGTELSNLHLNGNNFVSDTPVTQEQFEYNCSPVTISDGTVTERHENMECIQVVQMPDGWYFILLDVPEQELWKRKVTADMQYISMMTEVELD